MKKSLKKAILFSTLAFGTLEVTSVASTNVEPIVHADTTQTTNNQSNSIVAQLFQDPGMQQIILSSVKAINPSVKSINDITQQDLNNITTLTDSNSSQNIKLSSLTNIDKLTGLTSIKLDKTTFDKQINFSPVKQLTKLTWLEIENGGITSQMIDNLNGYSNTNLTYIDLSFNNIQDVNFMRKISIPNVSTIYIDDNNISDFSAVAGLNWIKLTTLDASNNKISDISPIAKVNWPSLTTLKASNNLISDVSPIAKVNWPDLTKVDVSNNKISDISVIKNTNWPHIDSIDVSNNQISDINPIASANWPTLTSIIADNNQIKNIDSFAKTNWVNIESISVNNNDISDISAMSGTSKRFPNLNEFSVDNNHISDLSFMYGFKFSDGSAQSQSIVKTTNKIQAPKKGETISIPVNLVDMNLDGNNVGISVTDPQRQTLLLSGLTNASQFTIIGKDGKPYHDDTNFSNGIDHINFTYQGGNLPSSVSFNFSSGLDVTSPVFTGTYKVVLNWQSDSTNTSTNTNSGTDDTIDSHKNNAGKPTVNYGKIIATRGLNLYRKNAFTRQNRIKNFKKATGFKRPLFKVLRSVSSSINTPRYYVVQIDPKTNKEIKGSRGYITARTNYVTPLYYSSHVKSVKVVNKTVIAYKHFNLKDAAKKYKRGTVLNVKSIKNHGNVYALQLQNGKFVTANKYFVVKIK